MGQNIKDKSKLVVSAYNKISKEYAEKYFEDKLSLKILDKFMDLLPKKAFVLDIGCGPGTFTQHFLKRGFKVDGIDISEKMIELAKEKVPAVTFKLMDMRELKYFDQSFDGLFAGYSLIHIPKVEIEKTLREFFRVLEKEGYLMIIAQRGNGEKVVEEPLKSGVKVFVNFMELSDLKSILEKIGFKVVYKKELSIDEVGSFSDKVMHLIVRKSDTTV